MTHPDFDTWLRAALHTDPEPDDAGFTLGVMAQLPVSTRRATEVAVEPWHRHASALAMACAGIGLGALALFAGAFPLGEQGLAAISLVGLLLWWSLPQSAGSGWR
jgi:hypothetical protein